MADATGTNAPTSSVEKCTLRVTDTRAHNFHKEEHGSCNWHKCPHLPRLPYRKAWQLQLAQVPTSSTENCMLHATGASAHNSLTEMHGRCS